MSVIFKELSNSVSYTATLYVNNNPTAFIVVIADGSVSFTNVANNVIALNAFDLISVHVQFSGGALTNGVTCALSILV